MSHARTKQHGPGMAASGPQKLPYPASRRLQPSACLPPWTSGSLRSGRWAEPLVSHDMTAHWAEHLVSHSMAGHGFQPTLFIFHSVARRCSGPGCLVSHNMAGMVLIGAKPPQLHRGS